MLYLAPPAPFVDFRLYKGSDGTEKIAPRYIFSPRKTYSFFVSDWSCISE